MGGSVSLWLLLTSAGFSYKAWLAAQLAVQRQVQRRHICHVCHQHILHLSFVFENMTTLTLMRYICYYCTHTHKSAELCLLLSVTMSHDLSRKDVTPSHRKGHLWNTSAHMCEGHLSKHFSSCCFTTNFVQGDSNTMNHMCAAASRSATCSLNSNRVIFCLLHWHIEPLKAQSVHVLQSYFYTLAIRKHLWLTSAIRYNIAVFSYFVLFNRRRAYYCLWVSFNNSNRSRELTD